jgi:uncharacterized sulfatase
LVDIFPTLADLCGLTQPPALEGTSFAPLLDNPDRPWKQAAFTVVSRGANIDATRSLDPAKMGRTVVTDRWRYTEWHDGANELYDHQADPYEYANLANDSKQSAARDDLHRLLRAGWQAAAPPK